ncbi:type III secretion system cytoplasmic ring protein SctQ [Collimonas pratensis]|uniref:Type III secretion apparatus protein, YscQ/HrcQ family n=1 Tax=Collimonas pratensis TaxID=279113 RepID=A0A127QAB8_9BURK|nr:type III secretion system cytoplasmic ring protein SctQ [Collimonas pratensis]AMP07009.1 type III secretion apparatus protein, YscQ/HrcQ family [Collimonas pratensis]
MHKQVTEKVRATPIANRLRSYPPALASLSRGVFDARSTMRIAVGAIGIELRAMPAASISFKRAATLRLDSSYGVLTALIDLAGHPALEAIALDSNRQRSTALANLWLTPLLEKLAANGYPQPSVAELTLVDVSTATQGLAFGFRLAAAKTCPEIAEVAVIVDLPLPLATLLERQWLTASGAAQALPAALSLPTHLRLRSRHCSQALLASLRCGDILLGWQPRGNHVRGAAIDNVTLRWGAGNGWCATAQASVAAHTITLENKPMTTTYNLDNDQLAEREVTEAAEQIDVGQLEIPVHLEIVTLNLPIAQIAALEPGCILELPVPVDDAQIRLVSHGQVLAFGELVAVGGQLGLQIHRMAERNDRLS